MISVLMTEMILSWIYLSIPSLLFWPQEILGKKDWV